MRKEKLLASVLMLLCASVAISKPKTSLVAIVSDSSTLKFSGKEIEAYAESIRQDGKRCAVIEDRWANPDSIRNELEKLYRTDFLEGAVFIGDIPVAMVRDAQHFTTAFKMDQRRDRFQSSVPSDRFYDDFNLKFDYLGKDEKRELIHYYSLRSDSPQYISCDIYSARIKAPAIPGKTKYEAVSEYLQKVVREKGTARKIDNIAYFAGHGYNSESMQSRVDEAVALNCHFNDFDGRISFTNYSRDNFVKYRFQAILEDEDVDIALLHHHGSDDTQYLSATPSTSSLAGYLDNAKRFMRGKIRSAKDTVKAKQYYIDNYDVPAEWLQNVTAPKITAEDDAYSEAMDVYIPDTYGRKGGPAFIMHDACFNGSFHLDDYIAGHYIFNPGRTVVVKGNSVNTLQDTWPTELIGLLGEGVCVGNWLKTNMTLESHILGDPTWRFASDEEGYKFDRSISLESGNPKFWRKVLKSADGDRKVLAVKMLSGLGAISADELLDIQKNDAESTVRLEAFRCISKYCYPALADAIIIGLQDDYELHRRLAAIVAGKNGDPGILPTAAKLYFDPTLSERVDFQLRTCLELFNYADVEREFSKLRAAQPNWPVEKNYAAYLSSLKRTEEQSAEEFAKLSDESLTFKQRRLTVSSQRNKCTLKGLDPMLSYLKDGQNQELRMLIAETLGWYVYSSQRDRIVETVAACAAVESDEALRKEMEKTVRRLAPEF